LIVIARLLEAWAALTIIAVSLASLWCVALLL
jgi:hypothetical protein